MLRGMAAIGKRNTLSIVRESTPGLYLNGGELGEILLPRRYIPRDLEVEARRGLDRKSTRLNSSHPSISYAVFCLKKKKKEHNNLVQRHIAPEELPAGH